jgi:hypothetical protein
MTTCLRIALLAFSLVAAACAPLQQAPLVYSSKVTVGLDVSANVAENQGASVNIGVKTLDSAYVPVAVSKEIDKKTREGDEKTLGLQLIEARYGEGAQADSSDPAGAAERNRKIDTYFAAKKAADDAASEHAKSESSLANRNGLISRLETLRSNIEGAQKLPETVAPATTTSQPQASARAEALNLRAQELSKFVQDTNTGIPALALTDGRYNVDEVTTALARQIDVNKAARDKLQADLPRLKAEAQAAAAEADRAKAEAVKVVGLSNTSKSDAMSVYGSFDSKATGDAGKSANAGLLIGKVFSTGLASQNLTEAVKIGASSQCASTGFAALQATTDVAERQRILEALSKVCSPQKTGNGK